MFARSLFPRIKGVFTGPTDCFDEAQADEGVFFEAAAGGETLDWGL